MSLTLFTFVWHKDAHTDTYVYVIVYVYTRMYTHTSAKQKNVDLHIFPARYTHTCKYVCTCAFTSVFVSACYVYISCIHIYIHTGHNTHAYIPGTIYTHIYVYIHKIIPGKSSPRQNFRTRRIRHKHTYLHVHHRSHHTLPMMDMHTWQRSLLICCRTHCMSVWVTPYIWMSHATHDRWMCHITYDYGHVTNESCHIEWVMSHIKWVMSRMNRSCHIWMRSCHVWMSHITYE